MTGWFPSCEFLSRKDTISSSSSSMIHAQSSLKGVNPAILLLRQQGVVNGNNLVNLYRILSSFGYHVIVPVDVLDASEIVR